jgi:nucleotide-binding universal stress UspA family protein
MSTKYVLSCINGYPPSQAVIDYGCWFAKNMDKGLKLFHAIDNQYHKDTADLSGSIGLGAKEELLEELVSIEHEQNKLLQKKSKLLLESAKGHAQISGVKNIKLCSRKGRVLDNILDFKEDISISIIGKFGKNHQGMSINEKTIGHKVEGLVKKINLPALIVSEDYKHPQSILLSYDGGDGANKVLNFLCDELNGKDLYVELVLFGEDNSKNQSLIEQAKEKLLTASYKVTSNIIAGDAHEKLPQYLQQAKYDILAMGAFSHGILHKLLIGSLTLKMITASKKPILLVS